MNIYHVWVPHLKRIFRARDVRIDETVKFDLANPHLDPLMITEVDDLIRLVEIPDLPDDAQADSNYRYEDWDDILASGLGPLSLESSQKPTATPASPKLRGYEEDSQLPIPEPIPAAADSPPAPDTGEQPTFDDGQTDQPEHNESNIVDELIDTSVRLAKKAPTQLRSADLLPEHIIQGKRTRYQLD